MRIVSLVPSLTELLFALELGDAVVGRTGFCVHPSPDVRRVPKMGGTKTVDEAAVIAARPTHVVVNIDENEAPTVERLQQALPQTQWVITHPCRMQDNLPLYARFGEVFERPVQAQRLQSEFEEAWQALGAVQHAPRPVIYLIWKDPWMTVSPETYIADALACVGLQVRAPLTGRRYPEIDWTRFALTPDDVVLFSSEPYRFTPRHASDFAARYGCPDDRCLMVDGEMTSWYGPRAIAGLRYLAELRSRIDRS
jgi:ABC-type Fe3+-hydroxamate transport system substrate-binding protein